MKKHAITDEYFELYEDEDVEFDKSTFETEQEIEVRIPFEGYYKLKVKCKDPQIAMVEVLKANRDIGIMSLVGGDWEIEDVLEDETYSIILEDK